MNEYLNRNIELIKNKNQYLEEALLKMREEVYDSLEKKVKYPLDKIQSYWKFKMIIFLIIMKILK